MINNKADTIEQYILQRLKQTTDRQIELKRTALADEISCAPSQISYVLSTRFTAERGFVVESRRGLGGYIKIALVPEELDQKQMLYRDMMSQIDEDTPFSLVKSMLAYLMNNKIITRREAEIMAQTVANFYQLESVNKMAAAERAKLTRSIFITLSQVT